MSPCAGGHRLDARAPAYRIPPRSARSTSSTLHGGREPAPLVAVGLQRVVDRVRRDRLAEFRPGGPVALPGALEAAREGMAGDHGQDQGEPAGCRLPAQVRDQVEEPRGRALPVLAPEGSTSSGQPAGQYTSAMAAP